MKRLTLLFLMLSALLLARASAETALTDDRGVEITVSAPSRVVCLYGSYAEAWLEAGGSISGVTEDAISERNLQFSDDVSVIGTTKEPNLELVIALDPELVIFSLDIAPQLSAAQVLESAGIPCAGFRVDKWQDYARMLDIFCQLTGDTAAYERIVPPMEAEITGILAESAAHEPPTVLLLRAYSTGVRAKASDNLAGIMLSDLGCVNIADSDGSLLEELSLEAIIAADPEFIFISVMGGDESAALDVIETQFGANPVWQLLTAVQRGNVQVLPRELFHYKPNSRWSESYAYLADILYGK